MALSFLSQNSGLLDSQTIFDPQHLLQQRSSATFEFSNLNEFDQMEFNDNLSRNHNQYHNQNSCHSDQPNSENINQIPSRYYISGYHHQHIGLNYEQVINFVDSPPNSEESWTDRQSKGSPRPQIIDVQTIYTNSGLRKRRMDWESLDIGHTETSPTAQSGELPAKVFHLEKEKQKREKQSGRSSWSDDIGFDLNAEFNNNSYLNNESFLPFSPGLATLKQEPHVEQLKSTKTPVNATNGKVGKSSFIEQQIAQEATSKTGGSHDAGGNNSNFCSCGPPDASPTAQEYKINSLMLENKKAQDKSSSNTGNGNTLDNVYNQCSGAVMQQLNVVEAAKIKNLTIENVATNSEDHKFQYILAAATSIATKNNEETLTYLNQGQSYEIKLKKIGDLSFYRDKILKSVIKICFHERRLQFMEREQMQQWQNSRPGERIIDVDVPLSYGLCHVSQPLNPNALNTVEIFWDPLKEVGVYVKVNCISTEFTPKKHGGEKGVPFRLQIETYIETTSSCNNNKNGTIDDVKNTNVNNANTKNTTSSTGTTSAALSPGPSGNSSPNSNSVSASTSLFAPVNAKQPIHAAACQIKVFKLKGADRKHKQDREKIQKRPQSEQQKFQPSYECTIMNEISLELIMPNAGSYSPECVKIWPNSPVHIPKYDGISKYANVSPTTSSSPIAINSVTSTNSPTLKLMESTNTVSPQHVAADIDDYIINIMPESTPAQVTQWLTYHRLTVYLTTFAHFSGADILRMSKEDLLQICGLADGIRMYNILRAKTITPRLTLYVCLDGSSYNAIYLISNTAKELTQKLLKLPGFYEAIAKNANSSIENGVAGSHFNGWGLYSKYSGSGSNIFNDVNKSSIYISGPSGIHVTVTDEVLNNEIKDGSLYALEVQNGKIILKLINKNEN